MIDQFQHVTVNLSVDGEIRSPDEIIEALTLMRLAQAGHIFAMLCNDTDFGWWPLGSSSSPSFRGTLSECIEAAESREKARRPAPADPSL